MRDCTLGEYVDALICYIIDKLDERYSEEMKLELLALVFNKYVRFCIEEKDYSLDDYISGLISTILYELNGPYSVEMRLELASLVLWVLFSKREFEWV